MDDRVYASSFSGKLRVPHQLPTGDVAYDFTLRRLTAKERREISKIQNELQLLQAKIRKQLVAFGSLQPPFDVTLLDSLDTINEDLLIEAQAAIDNGFDNLDDFREWMKAERERNKDFR